MWCLHENEIQRMENEANRKVNSECEAVVCGNQSENYSEVDSLLNHMKDGFTF